MPEVNWQRGGIVRWGAYVPKYRLSTELISKEWGGSGTTHKSVANIDEDATTLGIEAARRAVVGYDREIDCVFFGSESKPYAAKASAITVAESVGAGPFVSTIDLESACRGAVEGMFRACDGVGSGSVKHALVVASDVAHSAIGDPLEKTASAAAVAFVVGNSDEAVFSVSKPVSYATDTIDFHRRDGSAYPLHGGRFTGEPAYFHHTLTAASTFLDRTGFKAADFRFAVFHQPNAKFPAEAGKRLGFESKQLEGSMFANSIGNPYAANVPLGMVLSMQQCSVGDMILVTSYGSGAGSDCFALKCVRPVQANSFSFGVCSPVTTYSQYLRMSRRIAPEGF